MTSQLTVSVRDYSEEASSCRLHVPTIDATNHDAVVTSASALYNAVEDIVDGIVNKYTLIHSVTKISNVMGSSDVESRRERKMMVQYQDDTTLEVYTVEIPSPNMSLLTYDGRTDKILLADTGAMAAFVTAMEANAVSPNGNSITIIGAYVTGRLL